MFNINAGKAANIVRDAGGEIIGITRFHKIAYLLHTLGLDNNFRFIYKHFGPYSHGLDDAIRTSILLDQMTEIKRTANWGGEYSIFCVMGAMRDNENPRVWAASEAARVDAIVLDLAAAAIYFDIQGYDSPWGEVARRKPMLTTTERMDAAKQFLLRINMVTTPNRLSAEILT